MITRKTVMRTALAAGSIALVAGSLVACSSGGGSGSKTSITFLVQNAAPTPKMAKDMVAAFEKANPNITVKVDTQPAGTEGDNLMKTKLSTGSMDDVFYYNSGSLLQALNPDTQLVNLEDQSWVSGLNKDFKAVVEGSTGKGIYGAPLGTSLGGGVMYNKTVYSKLGLTPPTDWAGFLANSEKIKDSGDGVAPIIQSFGDTWTAQLFVLGDFANVAKQDPGWAKAYTANKEKYVDQPALQGFLNQAETFKDGLYNKDYASITNVQALKDLADGTGAQYPMLSSTIATIQQNDPSKVKDIGFFALPAQKAADTQMTIWQPNAVYIPKTTTGDKLTAAKKLVAFVNSKAGCAVQNKDLVPSGPYVTSACSLPSSVPPLINDIQKYFKSGATAPALEFLSPVKGPNLPAITVQVGSGISTGEQGAALYDQDVLKQAQQLGLKGW